MAFFSRILGRWWWLLAPVSLAFLLLLVATYVYLWPERIEDRIRQSITQALSERFHSDVELKVLRIRAFSAPNVTGEGLVLRLQGRTDVPPIMQVEKFSFSVGLRALLQPVRHISLLRVQGMLITIPPREKNNSTPPPPKAQHDLTAVSNIEVDRVICDDTDIRILPKQSAKEPLDWDVHNLSLMSAGVNKPFAFHGDLTNGKPKGEISTHGRFGPWDADDPGATPISGEYDFSDADLGPFPGIAGILSSTGKYDGLLSELQVNGETDIPDFSLDRVGRPVPLHTDFSATVDGTNGDTYLHPVNATLVKSLIVAVGKVVRDQEKHGHLISIDVTVPNGRIQDFLDLAINSSPPLLTGPVKIKAKLTIPPGNEHVIEKMILDGTFSMDDAKWSSPSLREKLASLSRHGLGTPQDQDTGSAVSDLNGDFHLEKGVLLFRSLTFGVLGAAIDLKGTYALRHGELDLAGHLRLQAKLSEIVTGKKSFFVKPLDPFFAKDGAGTVLPIHISGTRDNPVFGVTVFHKTFDKRLGQGKPKA